MAAFGKIYSIKKKFKKLGFDQNRNHYDLCVNRENAIIKKDFLSPGSKADSRKTRDRKNI